MASRVLFYIFLTLKPQQKIKKETPDRRSAANLRTHISRVGRWFGVDPLALKYPFASPYNFSLNTPIQAKDPDGKVVIFINGQHGSGDVGSKYWKGFDNAVMKRIGDYKPRYYDGALGGWGGSTLATQGGLFSSDPINLFAKDRYKAGYAQGMAHAQDIINNLARGKDGEIIESVKIISHSMGGAYAKGFASALNSFAINAANDEYLNGLKDKNRSMKNFKIEFEVDFASFQPTSKYNNAADGVGRTIQVSHNFDYVVNGESNWGGSFAGSEEGKEIGVKDEDYHLNRTDPSKDHKIQTFSDEINTTVPTSDQNPPPNGGAGGDF